MDPFTVTHQFDGEGVGVEWPLQSFLPDHGCGSAPNDYLGTLSPPSSMVGSSPEHNNFGGVRSSCTMSPPTEYEHYPAGMYSYTTQNLNHNEPYLKIIEQPTDRFRFRYRSEMNGTHGCLNAKTCKKGRKSSYPTVQLFNYPYPAVIRVSLYQDAETFQPPQLHAHSLVIRHSSDEEADPHEFTTSPNNNHLLVFSGFSIIHVEKRKLVPHLLHKEKRLMLENLQRNGVMRNLTQQEISELTLKCERECKNMDLNKVSLGFEAFCKKGNVLIPVCQPVFSTTIKNLKSAQTGDLKICRMDNAFSSCQGQQEVYMLVEKVNKKNIKVRFFELDNDDCEVWCDYGRFSDMDVHHQYAIVLLTPPYRFQQIEKPVRVFVELVRPSDNARSEPREFVYKPTERPGRKRHKFSESDDLPLVLGAFDNCSNSNSVDFNSSDIRINSAEIDYFLKSFPIPEDHNTIDGYSESEPVFESFGLLKIPAKRLCQEISFFSAEKPTSDKLEAFTRKIFNDLRTDDDETALHTAILCNQNDHLRFMANILDAKNHSDIVNWVNNKGETALHYAVYQNNPNVVKLLLMLGADVNLEDDCGNAALHSALRHSQPNVRVVQELLRSNGTHFPDLELENDSGDTPLHIAARTNQTELAKMLIRAKADVNHTHKTNGNTVLHVAVLKKNIELVCYLIEGTHIDVSIKNFSGRKAIDLAYALKLDDGSENVEEIFARLRETGPDVKLEHFTDEESDVESNEEEDDNEQLVHLTESSSERLAAVLDETGGWKRLTELLNFSSSLSNVIHESQHPSTILLKFASASDVTVHEVRQHLMALDEKEAVRILDDIYGT